MSRLRRWLESLRAWWLVPVLAELRAQEELLVALAQGQARLEALLARITPESRVTAGGHALVRWDCGHEHAGGMRDREGVTRCLACHERNIR